MSSDDDDEEEKISTTISKKELSAGNVLAILTILRRVMPSVIARQIVGVQPMGNYTSRKVIYGKTKIVDGQTWYNITCDDEVWQWVVDTIDQSQFTLRQDATNNSQYRFTLSEEATVIFKLKWS